MLDNKDILTDVVTTLVDTGLSQTTILKWTFVFRGRMENRKFQDLDVLQLAPTKENIKRVEHMLDDVIL